MKTIRQETTADAVGLPARKHKDWFDESDKEIQELLEKKCSCHNCLLAKSDDQAAKAAYNLQDCLLHVARLRTMQNDWWTALADWTQCYADNNSRTMVTCAPSMLSMDPHIRSKHLCALRTEVPC